MAWYAPLSGINSIVTHDPGDGVYIAPAVTISTYAVGPTGIGVWMEAGGSQVSIFGTVVSTTNIGVKMGSAPSEGGHVVAIEAGAQVRSFANFVALQALGNGTYMTNAGLIQGAGGVQFNGDNDSIEATLINSGTIRGISPAVANLGAAGLSITNSGLIQGKPTAIDGFNAVEEIINTGRIIGDINLLGGDDSYKGAKGRLIGLVSGGDGEDTLIGGIDAERFNGGAQDDTLTGGRGADQLTGGLNADRFEYMNVADSRTVGGRDTIVDFSRVQGDRIVLNTIDANTTLGGNQAFKFIGTAAFSGAAGELRYQKSGGNSNIFADTNGDSIADMHIVSDVALSFVKGDFVL